MMHKLLLITLFLIPLLNHTASAGEQFLKIPLTQGDPERSSCLTSPRNLNIDDICSNKEKFGKGIDKLLSSNNPFAFFCAACCYHRYQIEAHQHYKDLVAQIFTTSFNNEMLAKIRTSSQKTILYYAFYSGNLNISKNTIHFWFTSRTRQLPKDTVFKEIVETYLSILNDEFLTEEFKIDLLKYLIKQEIITLNNIHTILAKKENLSAASYKNLDLYKTLLEGKLPETTKENLALVAQLVNNKILSVVIKNGLFTYKVVEYVQDSNDSTLQKEFYSAYGNYLAPSYY